MVATGFKVIRISNYDNEGPRGDQRFVLTYPVTEATAKAVADLLNKDPTRYDDDWFRAVPDDHKLQEFQP